LIIPILLLVCAAFARAQEPGESVSTATFRQRGEAGANDAQAQTAEAATQSKLVVKAEGPAISYDQILADPDNLDLNFRWAVQQVLGGDVKGSAATLERLLMLQPASTKIRLMYGVVLYRLDDAAEAEVALLEVKKNGTPDEKQEAETYLKLIASRRRQAHFNAAVSAGWGFDDNRNAATASGQVLFSGTPIPLTEASQRRSDTAATLVANLGSTQDLGFQRGHSLFESVTYYQAEQTRFKNLNLKAYSLRGGGVYKSLWADFIGTMLFDHVQLSQATFLRDYGFDLKAEKHLSPRTVLFGRGAYQFQQYNPTEQLPTAGQRTGKQWDFSTGFETWIRSDMKLVPTAGYLVRDAASTFFAFRRYSLSLDHTWLLPKGSFLLTGLTANYDRYQSPDPLVSQLDTRSDDAYRFHTTYGLALSRFDKRLDGFVATAGYEYYWSLSNEPNFAYTSNKLSLLLTYSWKD
jgi:hypothetical protein